MAAGRKTGGRARGTPNRRTLDVIERLDALGCDPVEGMAKIAMDEAAPVEVRARMFAELAQYVAPKRKAIEHDLAASAAAAAAGSVAIYLPDNGRRREADQYGSSGG